MSIASEIRNDINGLEALHDWLGSAGVPAHPIVAQGRADRCTKGNDGEPCPMNAAPLWWEKAKEAVADWIRKELEIKNNMRLHVAAEEQLNMCKACGCCLPLKVWAPRDVIKEHTTKTVIDKTPSYCWMRAELNA